MVKKLNFGCGKRFASGWTNIDFHSDTPQIQRVNFLAGFPFPDDSFDVVYSSHVLEHFSVPQMEFLLNEAHRILKPNGILRIVVPNLENICREYLRVLDLPESDPSKSAHHEWMVIELLDQLVRSQTYGEMGRFYIRLNSGDNSELRHYVQSRIGDIPATDPVHVSWGDRLKDLLNWQSFSTALTYGYIKCVASLLPKNLRTMVVTETSLGERHRWMYDAYGLQKHLEKAGFCDCQSFSHQQSNIPDFNQDLLDRKADGEAYKPNSIYLEARLPA